MQGINNRRKLGRGSCEEGNIWGFFVLPVPPAQFFCKPKIVLKRAIN